MTSPKNNWSVYIHTCKINQKSYVGITSKKPEHRWNYGNGYKGQAFYYAIQKYGWDNFIHKIVSSNLSEGEAKKMEIYLIDKLKTHIKKNGYNVSLGGDGYLGIDVRGEKNPMFGKHHTEESRRKMSETRKKNPMTGSKHPMYGKINYAAIDAARLANSKTIYQFDLDMELIDIYENAGEAQSKIGVGRESISACCLGKLKTAGGYIWIFETDLEQRLKDKENIIHNATTNANKENLGMTVYQFDKQSLFIAKYDSLRDAAKAVNATHKTIAMACRGELKTAHGYIWRFEEDADKLKDEVLDFNRLGKLVLQFDMDGNFIKEYKSCAEAARENNLQRCGISKNCRKVTSYSGGYIWKFKDDYEREVTNGT